MKLSVPKRHIGKKLYTEIWKDIVGYEGLYQVSNMGRVESLYNGKEKILKPIHNSVGYLYVRLSKNGVKKYWSIHRLVALHFIPNPENKPYVDHIDTDKENNVWTNLRFVTKRENQNNPLTRKHLSDREFNGRERKIYCIETNKTYESGKQASEELGLFNTNIIACCRGKVKQYKGYHFYYVEDILYKN